jgi:hypothetical protein
MGNLWPEGFNRIPDADWTRIPIDTLARKYDSVEHHGWYKNLEPTLDDLASALRSGDLICDYSGGTGILADWLFRRCPDLDVGVLIADSSPKFLRLALEKLRDNPRVAFRQIEFLKSENRLRLLDEVIDPPLRARKLDGLVSTNAVHLYYDLPDTVSSWMKTLRSGAPVFVQSGNIQNPAADENAWIIDDTVEALQGVAMKIVQSDARFTHYREVLTDSARMAKYRDIRQKYFLPVRPLDYYVHVFQRAGLKVVETRAHTIQARVLDWFEFLAAYHDGVLGWVGGLEKVENRPPRPDAVRDRLTLIKDSINQLFDGKDTFQASWTYIHCQMP